MVEGVEPFEGFRKMSRKLRAINASPSFDSVVRPGQEVELSEGSCSLEFGFSIGEREREIEFTLGSRSPSLTVPIEGEAESRRPKQAEPRQGGGEWQAP